MKFTAAVKEAITGTTKYKGRASRSEYWWFYLFFCLVAFVAGIIDGIFFLQWAIAHHGYGPFGLCTGVVLTFPWISVSVRRLHDVNRSGWWMLLTLTGIGWFFPLLYWHIKKGTNGDNRFGPDPLSFYGS